MNWKIAVCMKISEENLKMLSEVGIKSIEIPGSLQLNPFNVSKEELKKIKELSKSYGIEIVASNVIYPPDLSHVSNDESLRKKSIEYTYKIAEAASEVDCPILVWGSGRARKILPEVSPEKGYERNLQVLREAAKAGEDFNVTFAIEPLPKNETNFINTIEEALKIVKAINSDFLKIIADVRHMIREERDLVESLRLAKEDIVHVHLADNNSKVPGRGIINFTKLFEVFKEIGYNRAMSIEAMLGENPKEELKFTLEFLERVTSNL
ncbi:MAG: sugar phosphate isomerase/epimerase family protein [Thermoproteota archaeon]|nr:sugar phosphate isomerase/epimerase [Candidatus Brockarchaeota archaeon]